MTRAVFSPCVVFGGPSVLWAARGARASRGFAYCMRWAFDGGAVFACFGGQGGVAAEFRFGGKRAWSLDGCMKSVSLGGGGMPSSLAQGCGVRSLRDVARGGMASSLQRRCIVRISWTRRVLSEGKHDFRVEVFCKGFDSTTRYDVVVLRGGCIEMLDIVMRIGVCRSRIEGCFIVAGRKLCGLSFEASCHFLDKRGNHGCLAELQLYGKTECHDECKQTAAEDAYQGIRDGAVQGSDGCREPRDDERSDGCAKKAQKERPQKRDDGAFQSERAHRFAEIDEADDVQDKIVCRFAQRDRRHADVKRPAYSRGEDCNEADLKSDASHHHHGVAAHDAHGGKHFLKIRVDSIKRQGKRERGQIEGDLRYVVFGESADVIERHEGLGEDDEVQGEGNHEKDDLIRARDNAAFEPSHVAVGVHLGYLGEHGSRDGHGEKRIRKGEPQACVGDDRRPLSRAPYAAAF